jgi:hypothetical protein
MQVLVVDLETTGLNQSKHGITEFGAVLIDLFKPGESKQFLRWLNPDDYVWSNYCLKLHADWIRKVTCRQQKDGSFVDVGGEPTIVKDIGILNNHFQSWLWQDCGYQLRKPNGTYERLVGAGKNFASFDLQFLEQKGFHQCFKRRSLDPGGLYTVKGDIVPPQLVDCKKRAIAEGYQGFGKVEVSHSALEDAMDVAHLLWHRFAS